jgi:hypothetical protein
LFILQQFLTFVNIFLQMLIFMDNDLERNTQLYPLPPDCPPGARLKGDEMKSILLTLSLLLTSVSWAQFDHITEEQLNEMSLDQMVFKFAKAYYPEIQVHQSFDAYMAWLTAQVGDRPTAVIEIVGYSGAGYSDICKV